MTLFDFTLFDQWNVRDPFGFNLQISGPGMTGFPDTNSRNNGGR